MDFTKNLEAIYGDNLILHTKDASSWDTDLIVECPRHGKFISTARLLIADRDGCPTCRHGSTGELEVAELLDEYNIRFEREKTFDDLIYTKKLRFDFWLPEMNTIIEVQGIQHFKPIEHFGGSDTFSSIVIKDSIKRRYCEDKKIRLIEVTYDKPFAEQLSEIIDEAVMDAEYGL